MEMAALKKNEKVIDIACGTGLVSFRAAAIVSDDGSVLANDISEGMVKIGNDLVKEKKLNNIKFERMDAEELDVPDATYDVALCALGL